MIKPIVYHDIKEKKKLEVELFSKIPLEKRKAISREFIDLFSSLRKQITSGSSLRYIENG